MCGVDQGLNKTKRIEELLAIEPLPNGEPFEIVEGGAKVWHLLQIFSDILPYSFPLLYLYLAFLVW